MNFHPSNGLRRVSPVALASECDVATRTARRLLQGHFPLRGLADGAFALTELEYLETRAALRKMAPRYATGFTPEKRRR